MNREILFRAKCSGKWRYGSYVHFNKKPTHYCFNCNYKDFIVTNGVYDEHYYAITELSSLGQYTGLKDKNGKEIFEGDILDYTLFDAFDEEHQYKGVVKWIDDCFICDNSDGFNGFAWVVNQSLELEVIGNITDNPELMK
jgi:hypothetical protein